jgi:hypothetical protein
MDVLDYMIIWLVLVGFGISFAIGYGVGYNKGWSRGYDVCEKGYWR